MTGNRRWWGGLSLLAVSFALSLLAAAPAVTPGTPTAWAMYGSLALLTSAALLALAVTRGFARPTATADGGPRFKAGRSAPPTLLRSSHPDAPGRSRPRAPGRAPAAHPA